MCKAGLYRYLALLLVMWCSAGQAEVLVEAARIRLPLPGQNVTVVYLQVKNDTLQDKLLTAVRLEGAERAEIHQHQHIDGMMQMRRVEQLPLRAGESIEFRPHGYHIMVFGVDALFPPGQRGSDGGRHELSLVFASGEVVRAQAREFQY